MMNVIFERLLQQFYQYIEKQCSNVLKGPVTENAIIILSAYIALFQINLIIALYTIQYNTYNETKKQHRIKKFWDGFWRYE